ncbi:MAG TPA: peptide deformylase [Kofleriaceae bacterium]|jgi:peptide deformylase|nr:peptide deformylase [Kofleriaceae bacterium]
MAVRPTVIWPDPKLREPTVAITTIDESVRELYRDLCDSMYAENGLGMAAPQIGDHRKMFIVEPKLAGKAETDPPVCLMNAEVIETSEDMQDSEEGCLSFPDIYIKVKRPMRCKVRYLGLDGQTHEIEGEALMARCLLHENDHLTGKLLVDFVGPLKRQMIKKKLQRVKDAEADEAAG